jgi:hypothetical protein
MDAALQNLMDEVISIENLMLKLKMQVALAYLTLAKK